MSVLSMDAMSRLQSYGAQMNDMEEQVQRFEKMINTHKEAGAAATDKEKETLLKAKGALAQMHGQLEKLQCVSIDAVMTGPLTSGKSDAKS